MPDDRGRETPYEIAERYARGDLDRDELLRQLTAYEYLPQDRIPDDMSVDIAEYVEGSWDDVEHAMHDRLIDAEIYGLLLSATSVPAPRSVTENGR